MNVTHEKLYAIFLFTITTYIFLPYNFQQWNSVLFNFGTISIGLIGFGTTASISFLIRLSHNNPVRFTLIDLTLGIYFILQKGYYLVLNEFSFEYLFFAENVLLCFIYLSYRGLNQKYFSSFLYIIPICAFIQIAYGIVHQTHLLAPGFQVSKITGSFINQGPFACFIAIAITSVLGSLNYTNSQSSINSKVFKVIIASTLIFFWIILLNTFSRAAVLAASLPTAYFLFILFGIKKKFKRVKRFYRIFILGLIIILGTSALLSMYYSKKPSADGRLLIWEVTMKMIQEKPILGHGVNHFEKEYMNQQASFLKTNQNKNYYMLAGENNYAFNELLRVLQEQGIIGLLLFLLIFLLIILSKSQHQGSKSINETLISKGIIITVFTFGLFSYPWEVIEIKSIAIACVAIIASYSKTHIDSSSKFHTFLSAIPVIVLFAFSILRTVDNYPSFVKWNNNLASIKPPVTQNDIKKLNNIYPELENNSYFLAFYGQILSEAKMFSEALIYLSRSNLIDPAYYKEVALGKIYQNMGQKSSAEEHWMKASEMIPSKFEAPYLILQMYYLNHNYEMVEKLASELLQKEIKVYSVEVYEMIEDIKDMRLDAKNQKNQQYLDYPK